MVKKIISIIIIYKFILSIFSPAKGQYSPLHIPWAEHRASPSTPRDNRGWKWGFPQSVVLSLSGSKHLPLLQDIRVRKQIRQQSDLPNQSDDIDEMEIPFFRLMSYQVHREVPTYRAAEKGQREQGLFRNTPRIAFCLAFIHRVHNEGNEANHHQNTRPNFPQHRLNQSPTRSRRRYDRK